MGWPLVAAAAVAAGASFFGARSTNSANAAIASSASAKNVKMMREGHDFSNKQARLAEAYTTQSTKDAWGRDKWAAQNQMDFQERMSNTQFQRGMADMKKSGLNPILAYSQGGAGGASGAAANATSGQGVAASASSAKAETYQRKNPTAEALASAMGVKQLSAQLKNINEDTSLKESQRNLNEMGQNKAMLEFQLIQEQIKAEEARVSSTNASTVKTRADTQKVTAETKRFLETGDSFTGRQVDTYKKMYNSIKRNYGPMTDALRKKIETEWENIQRKLGNR